MKKQRHGCAMSCRLTHQKPLLLHPSGSLLALGHAISYDAVPAVSQTSRERPRVCDHMGFDFMGTKGKIILIVFDSFFCI